MFAFAKEFCLKKFLLLSNLFVWPQKKKCCWNSNLFICVFGAFSSQKALLLALGIYLLLHLYSAFSRVHPYQ